MSDRPENDGKRSAVLWSFRKYFFQIFYEKSWFLKPKKHFRIPNFIKKANRQVAGRQFGRQRCLSQAVFFRFFVLLPVFSKFFPCFFSKTCLPQAVGKRRTGSTKHGNCLWPACLGNIFFQKIFWTCISIHHDELYSKKIQQFFFENSNTCSLKTQFCPWKLRSPGFLAHIVPELYMSGRSLRLPRPSGSEMKQKHFKMWLKQAQLIQNISQITT